ncbi:MAG: helix-turn-helix transcriptional regulator [Lachnospiraceae bacterium]|nr:helix-turn-helix transcriptional regulator [Lachnospiraceae bacterium]
MSTGRGRCAGLRYYCNTVPSIRRARLPRKQRRRSEGGISQGQLALLSGVPVRSIQQYEQRAKDINRAGADTLRALARALLCRMEDLMEPC